MTDDQNPNPDQLDQAAGNETLVDQAARSGLVMAYNDLVPADARVQLLEDPAPRFAAYDTRLARFVRGVHDTEDAAKKAAKAAGVKAGDTEIRSV